MSHAEGTPSPTGEADSDQALIVRLQAGDKAACAECIKRYGPGVYRLSLRLMRSETDAEDVMQETFLNAFKAIGGFEGRSGLSTWLYRIAYNAAMMRLRRAEPEFVTVDDPDVSGDGGPVPRQLLDWCCLPDEDFDTAEAHQELEHAIHDLPAKLRAVFVLRELEGLSTEATAEALDLSREVVKTRLHRARLWLRERLSGYFSELAQARPEH